jgi:hypothetical protein
VLYRVTRRYSATYGTRRIEWPAGHTERLDSTADVEFVAWINRDAPGTLEPLPEDTKE